MNVYTIVHVRFPLVRLVLRRQSPTIQYALLTSFLDPTS